MKKVILTLRMENPVLNIMSFISSNLCTASGFMIASVLSTKIFGISGTGIESSRAAMVKTSGERQNTLFTLAYYFVTTTVVAVAMQLFPVLKTANLSCQ